MACDLYITTGLAHARSQTVSSTLDLPGRRRNVRSHTRRRTGPRSLVSNFCRRRARTSDPTRRPDSLARIPAAPPVRALRIDDPPISHQPPTTSLPNNTLLTLVAPAPRCGPRLMAGINPPTQRTGYTWGHTWQGGGIGRASRQRARIALQVSRVYGADGRDRHTCSTGSQHVIPGQVGR